MDPLLEDRLPALLCKPQFDSDQWEHLPGILSLLTFISQDLWNKLSRPPISLKNSKDSHCNPPTSKQKESLRPTRADLMVFSLPFEARKWAQVSSRRVLCQLRAGSTASLGCTWHWAGLTLGLHRTLHQETSPLFANKKQRRLQGKWQPRDRRSRVWQRMNSAQAPSGQLSNTASSLRRPPATPRKHKGER